LSYLDFIPIQAQSSRFDFQHPSPLVYIATASTPESGLALTKKTILSQTQSLPRSKFDRIRKSVTGSETYLERATAHGGHPTCIALSLQCDLPEIQTKIKGINQSATKLKSISTSDEERITRKRSDISPASSWRGRGESRRELKPWRRNPSIVFLFFSDLRNPRRQLARKRANGRNRYEMARDFCLLAQFRRPRFLFLAALMLHLIIWLKLHGGVYGGSQCSGFIHTLTGMPR
jgi:hypothetical protein